MDTKQFEKIKKSIEEAQTRKDQLVGALDQLDKRIKKDYKVESIEELQKSAASTKSSLEKLQIKFDTAMEELQEMVTDIS